MINTQLSVAIHILVLINDDPKRSSKEIAESVNTNPVVVRRINGHLKKGGLLKSVPGSKGYSLVKTPENITLLDIYNAIELEKELFPIHQNPNPNCHIGKNIQRTLDITFDSIKKSLEDELKNKYLQEIIDTNMVL